MFWIFFSDPYSQINVNPILNIGLIFLSIVRANNLRSGSSFLGDILSLPGDSFYSFEPLRKIHSGDSGLGEISEMEREQIPRVLEGLFTCQKVRAGTVCRFVFVENSSKK